MLPAEDWAILFFGIRTELAPDAMRNYHWPILPDPRP